jgi:hypothetical protein
MTSTIARDAIISFQLLSNRQLAVGDRISGVLRTPISHLADANQADRGDRAQSNAQLIAASSEHELEKPQSCQSAGLSCNYVLRSRMARPDTHHCAWHPPNTRSVLGCKSHIRSYFRQDGRRRSYDPICRNFHLKPFRATKFPSCAPNSVKNNERTDCQWNCSGVVVHRELASVVRARPHFAHCAIANAITQLAIMCRFPNLTASR